jgi:membrane protein
MGQDDPDTRSRSRARRVPAAAKARVAAASRRGQDWVERQEPVSFRGVAIGTWRCYRDVEGPLQSALLSLYVLVAVLPALLVMEEYLDPHPNSLAHSLVHHFHLNAPTGNLIQGVLGEGHSHELGSALLAIVGALIFGLGFGRVLQLVHARAWKLQLPRRQTDQVLYGALLLGLYGLILLLLLQLTELKGNPQWVGLSLALGWLVLLVLFFVWGPWLLTHRLLSRRDLLPSAVLTAVGLVALILISRYLMQFWVDLYARDYGGLGVVLAIYFWLALSSALIVWAASLSPSLAERRRLRALSAVAGADEHPSHPAA